MGAPALLVLPDPSQQRSSLPSPAGSVFSPSESDSCVTSSSLSFSDSASSSFTQNLPPNGDLAPKIFKAQEHKHHRKQTDVLEVNVKQTSRTKLKQLKKSTSIEPLRESTKAVTSCTTRGSMRKACCRCAGAFAADCAALCCCPCAILSLLAFVVVELPSALARKTLTHLRTRLCIKDVTSARSGRGGDSIFTPTWSCREPSEAEGEKQAVSIIRFDTQNLLKHFEAEHVGFGCLSQKRE